MTGAACALFADGDRLDALADVLVSEADPEVARHVAACPVCAPALADLQAVLPAVHADLADLAGLPDVPEPEDLQERLSATLAAERTAMSADADPATAATAATAATVLPMPTARRPSWLPWAGGVAAAAVLLVGGLVLVTRRGPTETSTATSSTAAPGPVVNDTGTDYGRDGKALTAAVPRLLTGAHLATAQSSGVTPQKAAETALDRLRTSDGLASCLSSLTTPDAPGLPLAIDYAAYAGQPALVAVLPSTRAGKVDVFVLGAGCSAADAKVLFFTRANR